MALRFPRSFTARLCLPVVVPAIVLVPLAALGEPSTAPGAKAAPASTEKSDKYDPENVSGISQYMETVMKGAERFAAKDYTAAIDTLKKAIPLNPKNPLAPYLLTEAYLQQNNFGEAEAAIQQAREGNPGKNIVLRARVLFLTADVAERQKKWEDAKVAWQAYADFAAKTSGDAGVFPQTSTERLKAIQKVLEMEKPYASVRERIASDKADAGKGAPPKK